MNRSLTAFAVLALAGVLPTSVSAAVIAQYSGGFAAASTVAADASASGMVPGPKLGTTPKDPVTLLYQNAFYQSAPFFAVSRSDVTNTNPAGAYFTFTIGAAQGKELDLTRLSLNASKGGTAGAARTLDIKSSVDGYATSLTNGPVTINAVRPATNGTNWTNIDIDLGGTHLNLPSVTFRVYISTTDPGQNIDIDDVKLEGSVSPVPEPAALGALGSSAVMLVRRRAPRTK